MGDSPDGWAPVLYVTVVTKTLSSPVFAPPSSRAPTCIGVASLDWCWYCCNAPPRMRSCCWHTGGSADEADGIVKVVVVVVVLVVVVVRVVVVVLWHEA
jgi:hypothetical protein